MHWGVLRDRHHMHLGCRDVAARMALKTTWSWTARRSAAAVAEIAVGAVARTTAWAASRIVLIAARDHRHGVRVRNFRLVKARFKFEC